MRPLSGSTHFPDKKAKGERYWLAPMNVFTQGASAVLGITGLSKDTREIFDQGRIYSSEQAVELLPLIERFETQVEKLSQDATNLREYLSLVLRVSESESISKQASIDHV